VDQVAITPAREIQFWRDDKGYMAFSAKQLSPTWMVGQWLLDDVQGSGYWLLEILDGITSQPYERSGNAWFARIDGDQMRLENHFMEKLTATIALDHLLGILRAYWDALGDKAIAAGREEFFKFQKREPNLPW
jgi:hypothetical protein